MAYAVELDLLAEVDRQVLELAVSAHEAWQKCGFYIPRISVNVSASRLQNNALIFDLQERSDLPFEKLSFEVLETALIDEDPAIIWNVDSLREMGVGIEVDDFGTGHASLSSVLAIRPDRVKIDRSFVIGIEADEKKREFLEVLISLAKRVGASTTVEGVETDDHKRIVSELGATEFQGFAIARPMSADAMMKWVAERTTGTVAVRCSSVDSAHCNTGD
jgi:Amt family ammonium transporter